MSPPSSHATNRNNLQQLGYRNTANLISLLGISPLLLLLLPEGLNWLPWVIVLNNIADDLDGLAAGWMNIRSQFGAHLDNVCDAIVHGGITLILASHLDLFGMLAGYLAACSVVIRSTRRLIPDAAPGGSPTNDLMRHSLVAWLVAEQGWAPLDIILPGVFLLHAVSMQISTPMPWLIRSLTRTPAQVIFLNICLCLLIIFPTSWPVACAAFTLFTPYLASLTKGLVQLSFVQNNHSHQSDH
ncbi:CDP-alcohol phosphatidyltransferase family protein [Hahella ganghwensis]|uniref:CDP-alcohol phosphatidyltransferase family protein n=1 Tax=Hahella ganghwensis TaxID=286420 RepID=UPI000366BC0E|nr:CDP-alcohol phosphatidyltransferase family protein [Hahella ganghwensis]